MTMETVDAPAHERLDELEGIVDRGLDTFVEVGRALAEIRDHKLYLAAGSATFEGYCKSRWEPRLSYTHAYRLIEAAGVVDTLPTGKVAPPATERQARELVPLARKDPEAAAEVWSAVVEAATETGKPVTAIPSADVRAAVRVAERDSELVSRALELAGDPYGEIALSQARLRVSRAIAAVYNGLLEIDPETLPDVLSESRMDRVGVMVGQLRAWCDRYEAASKRGIHVVGRAAEGKGG